VWLRGLQTVGRSVGRNTGYITIGSQSDGLAFILDHPRAQFAGTCLEQTNSGLPTGLVFQLATLLGSPGLIANMNILTGVGRLWNCRVGEVGGGGRGGGHYGGRWEGRGALLWPTDRVGARVCAGLAAAIPASFMPYSVCVCECVSSMKEAWLHLRVYPCVVMVPKRALATSTHAGRRRLLGIAALQRWCILSLCQNS
jgi:hypothetical protein